MTTHNEKTAPTAGTVDAESKSFSEGSISTAYIAKPSLNTRHTLGTFSGKGLTREGFMSLVVSIDAISRMANGEPVRFQIDAEDMAVHEVAVERAKAKLREKMVEKIANEVRREYEDEYKRLDAEAEKVYSELNAIVNAEIQAKLERLERK